MQLKEKSEMSKNIMCSLLHTNTLFNNQNTVIINIDLLLGSVKFGNEKSINAFFDIYDSLFNGEYRELRSTLKNKYSLILEIQESENSTSIKPTYYKCNFTDNEYLIFEQKMKSMRNIMNNYTNQIDGVALFYYYYDDVESRLNFSHVYKSQTHLNADVLIEMNR